MTHLARWIGLLGVLCAIGCDDGGSDDAMGTGAGTGSAGSGGASTDDGTGGGASTDDGTGGTVATGGTGVTGGDGGGGGGGAATAPDPCELVSAEEWATVMDDTPTVLPRASRCDWTHEAGGPPATDRQSATMTIGGAGAYSMIPMSEPIDIGDEGQTFTIAIARTVEIDWKKGDFSATFKYSALVLPEGKTFDEVRDAVIALARDAADRMP